MAVPFLGLIPVMVGIISLFGIILQNKFIMIIGTVMFLYYFGGILSLPPFMWLVISVVLFFTIMGGKKK